MASVPIGNLLWAAASSLAAFSLQQETNKSQSTEEGSNAASVVQIQELEASNETSSSTALTRKRNKDPEFLDEALFQVATHDRRLSLADVKKSRRFSLPLPSRVNDAALRRATVSPRVSLPKSIPLSATPAILKGLVETAASEIQELRQLSRHQKSVIQTFNLENVEVGQTHCCYMGDAVQSMSAHTYTYVH